VPLPYRLANAVHSYAAYLVDSVWPRGLAAFYPYPTDLGSGEVAASLLLLLAVTATSIALFRRQPPLLVGWLWFLGTLVPTAGILQVGLQARADRYMYLPLVGLAITLAWGGLALVEARGGLRRVTIALASGSVLALAVAAHAQVRLWQDTLTLFSHASAVTDGNYFAHQMMGNAFRDQGRLADAERELRDALRIKPASADARIDLAAVLVAAGRLTQARAELARAGSGARVLANYHVVAGLVAEQIGSTSDAIADYSAALEREPGHREASNNLAWLLATAKDPALRDPERAIELARALLARAPGDAFVLDTLAAGYAAAGRHDEAVRTQQAAIDGLGPTSPARADFARRLEEYRTREK
jgi:tetratricopeptide (TPR) repeat protein